MVKVSNSKNFKKEHTYFVIIIHYYFGNSKKVKEIIIITIMNIKNKKVRFY